MTFDDIAPFDDSKFKENMAELVKEPGFEHAVRYVLPMVDYDAFSRQLMTIDSKNAFQRNTMAPFLEMLANKTSAGISVDGMRDLDKNTSYTYISNHRDIVLDASFLNLGLLREGFDTCNIALGDNLLIYDWIERLVKLNKGFIVKRNLKLIKAFEAAKQLSGFIHHCVGGKHESVWIAQREGRAKDSDDRTQESVLKMFALAGEGSTLDRLMELNICPTTISYEYDPNDYLKAKEFLLRKNDSEFRKSQRDDLLSMETGLLGYKGRIHYQVSGPINDEIESLRGETDKTRLVQSVASVIDRHIHLGYRIYPVNYISFDRLTGRNDFAGEYTAADVARFDSYIEERLKKVDIEGLSDDDVEYMRHMMLIMYSNPLKNKLNAEGHPY